VSIKYEQTILPVLDKGLSQIKQAIDTVNNWVASKISGQKGSVEGVLIDKEGKILPNYLIQIGPKFATTNQSGRFVIYDLPIGLNEIVRVVNSSGIEQKVLEPVSKKMNILGGRVISGRVKIDTKALPIVPPP
jgi:hypothetical protein